MGVPRRKPTDIASSSPRIAHQESKYVSGLLITLKSFAQRQISAANEGMMGKTTGKVKRYGGLSNKKQGG